MSIESMISTEPVAFVLSQAQVGLLDADGLPVFRLNPSGTPVSGRMVKLGARQQEIFFAKLGVAVEYKFITLAGNIDTSKFILTAYDQLFRVKSSGDFFYPKGTIPLYFEYACEWWRNA